MWTRASRQQLSGEEQPRPPGLRGEIREGNVTSAVRYSRMAALYTAAVAPTLPWLVVRDLRCLWMRPTGNCGGQRNKESQRPVGERGGRRSTHLCGLDMS